MRVFFIFITLLIVSCTSEDANNVFQIKKVLSDQEKAWNQGDIEGYMAGYLRSDSLRFASGGNVTYGWQTTLDRYKKGYPNKA